MNQDRETGNHDKMFTPEGYYRPDAVNQKETCIEAEDTDNADKSAEQAEIPEPEMKAESGSSLVDFNYDEYAEVEKKATRTEGKIALAAGIGSMIFTFLFVILGIGLGIAGLIFGLRGRKDPEQRGMATAGVVCSVIGLVLSSLAVILSILFIGAAIGTDIFMDF